MQARAYLDEALEVIEEHSINRGLLDWAKIRSSAYASAGNAQTPAATYATIKSTLLKLMDRHSVFMTPAQVADLESGALNAGSPEPSGRQLGNGLVLVLVPQFAGSTEAGEQYAQKLQGVIRELDASHPCGWIVDLRYNQGGNMWPMLAGIGPLLGEGRLGFFRSPDGEDIPWSYVEGQARQGDEVMCQVGGEFVYPTLDPLPRVAVLTGPQTLSSGEAVALAFRGRPETRSFGQATGGLTSANEPFFLSDGACIVLTVSRFVDRTGRSYSGPVTVDVDVPYTASGTDLAVDAAEKWLLAQPGCTG